MQTLETISTRRSIRAFTPDPVSADDLDRIVKAGIDAPSGGNAQMCTFISIRDPKRIKMLRSLAPGIIGQPTAVIVICLDKRRRTAKEEGKLGSMPYIDLGAALENILLAAHDLGLGGCAIGSFHPAGVASFLNLPEEIPPVLLVAIGKPKTVPSCPPKLPVDQVHYRENYRG